MHGKESDRCLGMRCNITRRDFVHGVGMGLFATGLPGVTAASDVLGTDPGENYPPIRTGMRGSHKGSFEVAHSLAVEGKKWPGARILDEHYDLVIVGGGMSGLAAASYFRAEAGDDARILIIENHDDFGGHAKRNEFHYNGKMLLAWGGAVDMEYPGYDKPMLQFLNNLGVDLEPLIDRQGYYFGALHGLKNSTYFDSDHYGRDKLIVGVGVWSTAKELASAVHEFPFSDASKKALKQFLSSDTDLLAPMTGPQRTEYLERASYDEFLRDKANLTEEARGFFNHGGYGNWGVGTDAIAAIELLADGWAGADRVGDVPYLDDYAGADDLTMFPDGNASLARLIVRELIPSVSDGDSMLDIATSVFDYRELDNPWHATRIRLNATAVNVQNRKAKNDVAVAYVKNGNAYQVVASRCVLACNNLIIPYLCSEILADQANALKQAVRTPLVVTNILLSNAGALDRLGISASYSPARMHAHTSLVGGLDIGSYQQGWNPDDPCIVQGFTAMPGTKGNGNRKAQFRAGKQKMLGLSFQDYEREVRVHLNGLLGVGGFDAARDIKAITVNRWPHGYAYEYSTYDDADYQPGEAPNEIARQRVGRIAIANSDAGASAYVDSAVAQAKRAINDLKNV